MKNVIKMLTHMVVWGTGMMSLSNYFGSQQEGIAYSLGTAALAGVCYLLRWRMKKLWAFLASHLVLTIGGFVLISQLGIVGWYKAILLLLVAYSAILRLAPSMESYEKPGRAHIVILAIIYILLFIYQGPTIAKEVCFWSIILLFLLKLLHDNLEKVDNYILTRSLSAEMDQKRVKRLSTQFSVLYTGAIGVLVGGLGLLSMDVIWETIGGWLDAFIRFLVRLIPSTATIQEGETEQVSQGGNGLIDMLQGMNQKTSFRLPEWLDLAIVVLVGIILLALLITTVIGIITATYRYFYSRRRQEEGEQVVEVLSDVEKVTDKKKKQFFERFERNPARRVRKIYKKNMKKLGVKQMARFPFMSPDEQVQLLYEEGFDESTIKEIRNLYEKARYGENSVTDAEVARMRSIM